MGKFFIKKEHLLYSIFFLMMFWDILDDVLPKIQFAIIAVVLLLFCMKYRNVQLKNTEKIIIAVLFIHGVINSLLGNNTFPLFLIQFIPVVLCYITFSNVISKFSINEIFSVYWKFGYVMSVIGLVESVIALLNLRQLTVLPLIFTYTKFDYRVMSLVKVCSLCREPSFLTYFLVPLTVLILLSNLLPGSIDTGFEPLKNKKQCFCIFAAYILTFSALAYLGIFFVLLIIWMRMKLSFSKCFFPAVIILGSLSAYFFISEIKYRVDDTFDVFFVSHNLDKVNLSTYALYSNFRVSTKTFENTWGIGSGMGSYELMYDRFNIFTWNKQKILLNREDANSAFLRIFSELGIPGIICVVTYLLKYRVDIKKRNNMYSTSVLILLLLLLIRQGNYTHCCSVMFVCLYKRIGLESQKKSCSDLIDYIWRLLDEKKISCNSNKL